MTLSSRSIYGIIISEKWFDRVTKILYIRDTNFSSNNIIMISLMGLYNSFTNQGCNSLNECASLRYISIVINFNRKRNNSDKKKALFHLRLHE